MNKPKDPTFVMLVGLVASGKSHYAIELQKKGYIIHSSDALREELFGNTNDQNHNQDLFAELHRRIKVDLSYGKDVVYDATNLNSKRRVAFLQELKWIPCKKVCVLIATPYKKCLEQNKTRHRVVPEEVIKKMYMSFNIPHQGEGWDDVQIVNRFENSFGTPSNFVAKYMYYNQSNSHHKLSLGEHCQKAWRYLRMTCGITDDDLLISAKLHDCGKPFTRDNHNAKDEMTEDYHYYNHHYVGAYDSLFYDIGKADHIKVALLIQYHMNPYLSWEDSDKSYARDCELLGDLIPLVLELHKADVYAH